MHLKSTAVYTRSVVKSSFTTLQVDLTHKCNTSCKYCVAKFLDRDYKDLDLDTVKKILIDSKEFNISSYVLACLAEVNMYKYLSELLEFIDSNFNRVNVAWDTNGILLTDELYNCLSKLKNNNYIISVSMWGFDLDSYKEYHTVPNPEYQFNSICNNIKRYSNLIKVSDTGSIKLNFSTPYINDVWKDNIYSKILDLLDNKYKVDCTTNNGLSNSKNIELYLRPFVNIYDNIVTVNDKILYNDSKSKNIQVNHCNVLFNKISITNDGNVFICIPSNSNIGNSLGNIRNTSLKDILYGSRVASILDLFCNNKFPFKECSTCRKLVCYNKE